MSFLRNVVPLIVFVIISFNVASPSVYALISFVQSDREGYIKQNCEHAGGMYKGIDESHYACTFIDYRK